jgi:hypothetical protein
MPISKDEKQRRLQVGQTDRITGRINRAEVSYCSHNTASITLVAWPYYINGIYSLRLRVSQDGMHVLYCSQA